jgi:hypothetical protein
MEILIPILISRTLGRVVSDAQDNIFAADFFFIPGVYSHVFCVQACGGVLEIQA